MKKIYLLLVLLCCLSLQGFCTKWYSIGNNVRLDSLKNWAAFPSGAPPIPTTFLTPGDTFFLQTGMIDSGGWKIGGTLIIQGGAVAHINRQNEIDDTITIGGSLIMQSTGGGPGYIHSFPTAGKMVMYIGGNLSLTGTANITSTSPLQSYHIHFNGRKVYPGVQLFTRSGTGVDLNTSYFVDSAARVQLNSPEINIPSGADSGFIVYGGGALICGIDSLDGQGTSPFKIYSDGSIYTASQFGLNGSIIHMSSVYFDQGAHFVFNCASNAVIGTYHPSTLVAPGSDTISVGGFASIPLPILPFHYMAGTSLCLNKGQLLQAASINMHDSSGVYVDSGYMNTNPSYSSFVKVTYCNLGLNAPVVSTGRELTPGGGPSGTTIGKIIVNKPGATITLTSSPTANDSFLLLAGNLSDGISPSYNITAKSAWINNSGPTAFLPHAGKVIFSGSLFNQYIGGTFPTNFNDLTLDNSLGATFGAGEYVDDTLRLTTGNLRVSPFTLTLGAHAAPVAPGTFSNSNMIIASSSTGGVLKLCSADSFYLFPIGDTIPRYSPITVYFHGGSYSGGSVISVYVIPDKHPFNMNMTDYINRYWNLFSSIGGVSIDSVISTYDAADVVGSPTDISMGQWVGAYPWIKHYPAVANTLTTANFPMAPSNVFQFTGLSTDGPTVTVSPDTLICGTNSTTLSVLTATRDTPFTYTWSPADFLDVTTGTSVVVSSPTVTTTYTVTVTDGNGFIGSATITVSVNPMPSVATVDAGLPICAENTLTLTSTGPVNVATYSWAGPVHITDSTLAVATVPNAGPEASGVYTLTVTNGIGIGCSVTYTTTATVNPLPGLDTAIGGGVFCDSTKITATGGSGGIVYYQGTTPMGTDITYPIFSSLDSILVTTSGTYYFRPVTALGCWGKDDSVTVRINYAPFAVFVSGASPSCDSTMIVADNGLSGTMYYQGTTSGGTSTAIAADTVEVYTSGTYYFRALSDSGCWSVEGSFVATINNHAGPVNVTGGGTFCDHTTVRATYAGSDGATVHVQAGPGGTDPFSDDSLVVTASGTYYFRAVSPEGCWGPEDSVTVVINPLPTPVTISPNFGAFCDSVLIVASNGDSGTIYYQGSTPMGTSTATLSSAQMIYAVGPHVYYFRAVSSEGCWSTETDSAQITINTHAGTVTTSGGGGPFCGNTVITGNVTDGSTVFFQGTTSGGTDMSLGGSPQVVTSSGTYYFRAISAEGCWGQEGSVTVLINPLPDSFTVTGGGDYCFGGTGYHVGLANSQLGMRYQLYLESSASGDPLDGTGTALDFGLFTTQGHYTVVATDTTTHCDRPMNGEAIININALPLIYHVSPPSGIYCTGGRGIDILMDGDEVDVNYYVYNGSTLVNIVPGTAGLPGIGINLGTYTAIGTYTVSAVRPATGCASNMLDSAVINTYPLPNLYTVSGGGAFCQGDTGYHVFLSGTDSLTEYQLFNSGTPVGGPWTGTGLPIDFGIQTIGGVYTVSAHNPATTCDNNMSGSATITVNPLPIIDTVFGGGSYCSDGAGAPIFLTGSEAGVDYKLYNGATLIETVPGTGTPPLDFGPQTLAGIYTVVATNATTGCTSNMDSSAAVAINGLPDVYTIFGGGSYCIGGTGFNVGITGSQPGKSYQLYNGSLPVGDTLLGTGAILLFGNQTAGGTYTVIATDTSTGCTKVMSGSTTIIVNSLPIIYTVTGGGSYCNGGVGRHVNLSGSNIGIVYQLYNDATPAIGLVPGTGSAVDFGLFLPTGTYWATALDVVTGCSDTMTDSVTIITTPLPTAYTVTGGGNYCVSGTGVHVGLDDSHLGIMYQLYKGTIAIGGPVPGTDTALDFGLQTGAGTYTVVAQDTTTGCMRNMTGSVSVSINPLPAVYLMMGGGSIIFCLGDTGIRLGLTGSEIGKSYQLYNGTTPSGDPLFGTGSPLDFGLQVIGGTYTIVATDTATGCVSTMSGSSVITVNAPLIPSVTLVPHPGLHIGVGSLDTLVAVVTGTGLFPTFQWYINGNLVPGATNDTFSFEVYFNTDSISCEVTSHGTCGGHSTKKSVFITLFDVNVKPVTVLTGDVKLIPNPNKGQFTLKGSLGTPDDQDVFIEVTDMLGQVIYKNRITATGGNINEHVQLNSTLANGMYLLNMRTSTQSNVFHFVVEQ